MNTKIVLKSGIIIVIVVILLIIISCSGEKIREFNDNMKKISKTVDKIDSFNMRVSKGATKFSKHMEEYMDTTVWYKDSTGSWHPKDENK